MFNRWHKLRDLMRQMRGVRPELEAIQTQLASVEAGLSELSYREASIATRLDQSEHAQVERHDLLMSVMQIVADGETDNRRRLWQLREDGDRYDAPFIDRDPLVSITIPTYRNFKSLAERALPSALAQTHHNIEVVVVGDRAPDETAAAIAEFDDRRIRYVNLERRGPYPDQKRSLWLVAGIPPWNEANRLAKGAWIAPLNDDDSFRPDHIEKLLAAARMSRSEVSYGKLLQHMEDGAPDQELGVFPPETHKFGWQMAIYHEGLQFFEFELSSALFDIPGDWSLCRRMLRAGVRFTMIDEIIADYYPSLVWDQSST